MPFSISAVFWCYKMAVERKANYIDSRKKETTGKNTKWQKRKRVPVDVRLCLNLTSAGSEHMSEWCVRYTACPPDRSSFYGYIWTEAWSRILTHLPTLLFFVFHWLSHLTQNEPYLARARSREPETRCDCLLCHTAWKTPDPVPSCPQSNLSSIVVCVLEV